jgi:hypothetical protein
VITDERAVSYTRVSWALRPRPQFEGQPSAVSAGEQQHGPRG